MRRASLAGPSLAVLVSPAPPAAPSPAQAVRPDAGLEGSSLAATLSQRFEVNDNYNLDDPSPGTSYFADTRLALDYLKADRHPELHARPRHRPARALGGGGGLRVHPRLADHGRRRLRQRMGERRSSTPPSSTASARSTTSIARRLRHGPRRAARRSRPARGQYLRAALRRQRRGSLRHRSPLDLRAALPRHADRLHRGHPDQVARTTLQGEAAWNLRLNPVLSSTVFANYSLQRRQRRGAPS